MRIRILGLIGSLLLATLARAQEITIKPESAPTTGSEFLKPPGASNDLYAPAVDWARVPPWRQTSFFGVRAQGKVFVYVVDCSGSMATSDRLVRAKREIRRTVNELRFPQRFHVIFYNDQPIKMPGGGAQSVDLSSKTLLTNWLRGIEADGETDPRSAMTEAFAQNPDGIFLLSDGEYPEGAVEAIKKQNTKKVPIHCIDFAGDSVDLQKIARSSGGQYARRP